MGKVSELSGESSLFWSSWNPENRCPNSGDRELSLSAVAMSTPRTKVYTITIQKTYNPEEMARG